MSGKNKMIMKYPAGWWQSRWRETLPLGNGIIGASVYGGVWDETIMITHTDLFWKSKTPELPDISYILPEVRKALLDNDPYKADKLMAQELRDKGYDSILSCPLPLCDLKIKMVTDQGFKNYLRVLDMEKAEVNVSWNDGDMHMERNGFVAYDKDAFVYEIAEKSGKTFSCELQIAVHELEDAQWYGNLGNHVDMFAPHQSVHEAGSANQCEEYLEEFLPKNRVSEVRNETYLVYTAKNDDGTDFGAVAKVVVKDGTHEIEDDKLVVKGATKVEVILKTFIKGDKSIAVDETMKELDDITADYATLFEAHLAKWSPLFLSTELNIDTGDGTGTNEELLLDAYQGEASLELIEKMWAYGRYLLLAAAKEGGNPCNLYGLWCGEYKGKFSFSMANENLQVIYWQALSGNTPELLLPLFDCLDNLMDDFRVNAKNLYGCRGIFVPGPFNPDSGLNKINSPHILHWTGGAGWLGQHYYDYYLCTQDKEFLEKRAIPYLKETVLFYEDFLILDENGYYMTVPSNSPENSPGNYWDGKCGMGVIMETTMNATLDFAIIKEVLTNLIEGCKICDVEAENIDKWSAMLEKVPPYQINEDGAIKEWMHDFFDDNYRHRHQSHVYPMFPGNEIHKETDPELYEAFVVAVKKRLEIGINQQCSWSLMHMSNSYARMQENELALECLDLMCRSCVLNNFMTTHNDWRQMGIGVRMEWAPVQLDANMGLTAAINEMLMQSYSNTIRILPAIPSRFKTGSVKNLLSRQGILISIEWNLETGNITVTFENPHGEKEIKLLLPEGYACENAKQNGLLITKGKTVINLKK